MGNSLKERVNILSDLKKNLKESRRKEKSARLAEASIVGVEKSKDLTDQKAEKAKAKKAKTHFRPGAPKGPQSTGPETVKPQDSPASKKTRTSFMPGMKKGTTKGPEDVKEQKGKGVDTKTDFTPGKTSAGTKGPEEVAEQKAKADAAKTKFMPGQKQPAPLKGGPESVKEKQGNAAKAKTKFMPESRKIKVSRALNESSFYKNLQKVRESVRNFTESAETLTYEQALEKGIAGGEDDAAFKGFLKEQGWDIEGGATASYEEWDDLYFDYREWNESFTESCDRKPLKESISPSGEAEDRVTVYTDTAEEFKAVCDVFDPLDDFMVDTEGEEDGEVVILLSDEEEDEYEAEDKVREALEKALGKKYIVESSIKIKKTEGCAGDVYPDDLASIDFKEARELKDTDSLVFVGFKACSKCAPGVQRVLEQSGFLKEGKVTGLKKLAENVKGAEGRPDVVVLLEGAKFDFEKRPVELVKWTSDFCENYKNDYTEDVSVEAENGIPITVACDSKEEYQKAHAVLIGSYDYSRGLAFDEHSGQIKLVVQSNDESSAEAEVRDFLKENMGGSYFIESSIKVEAKKEGCAGDVGDPEQEEAVKESVSIEADKGVTTLVACDTEEEYAKIKAALSDSMDYKYRMSPDDDTCTILIMMEPVETSAAEAQVRDYLQEKIPGLLTESVSIKTEGCAGDVGDPEHEEAMKEESSPAGTTALKEAEGDEEEEDKEDSALDKEPVIEDLPLDEPLSDEANDTLAPTDEVEEGEGTGNIEDDLIAPEAPADNPREFQPGDSVIFDYGEGPTQVTIADGDEDQPYKKEGEFWGETEFARTLYLVRFENKESGEAEEFYVASFLLK